MIYLLIYITVTTSRNSSDSNKSSDILAIIKQLNVCGYTPYNSV